MGRSAIAWVLWGLLFGCTTTDRYRGHQPPEGPLITVLVPGYRGSFLYDDDRRVYLDPASAFRPGLKAESLGTCSGGMKPLAPGGPMTKFTIWPYAFNVYDDFMEWGRQHVPAFTAFGYDWRADLKWNGGQLCEFIGDRKANVVAHSMGGLVTMLAVQQCPEKIAAVVFAGVPFGGAPGLFTDLFLGASTYQNTALLSPEALWTFPATWQLLPRTDDFFVDDHDQPLELPISKRETWSHWELPCPQRLAERLADRAAMPAEFEKAPARSLAVVGRGKPSTAALRVHDGFFDFEHPLRADGDGTVLVTNAIPRFQSETVFTSADHVRLLDDPAVRKAIEAFFK
jgi:pimeloyl-ACP methyl ester carboxylesterase